MPQYMITYLGGNQPTDPEEGKAHFEKYMEWLNSLGTALVSPMNPIKDTSVIRPDGSVEAGSVTAMSGYTVVKADSSDEVITMAKACPFLEIGGSLEVSEFMQMGTG